MEFTWLRHAMSARATGALASTGLVLGVGAALITYHGNVPGDLGGATLRFLSVTTPIVVGLFAWRHPPHEAFGRLLCLCGLMWFLAALGTSSVPLLYSVGRTWGAIAELFLLVTLLAYPSGRLADPVDRVLAFGALALVVLVQLPSTLLLESFPVPAPSTLCVEGCPPNALNALGNEPAWAAAVLPPLAEGLTMSLVVAVLVRLGWRMGASSRLMRLVLAPVIAVVALRLGLLVAALAVRRTESEPELASMLSETLLFGVAFVAVTFLIGLFAWRLHVAEQLQGLATRVSARPDPQELRNVIAGALGDPTVEILTPARDGWVDHDGASVAPPRAGSGRMLTEVLDGRRRVAAILHADVLAEQRPFVEAIATYAMLSLDNDRLTRRVRSSRRALADSRQRLAAAADEERRRIERDLHDGAQQRLVALRIRLEIARELVGTDPDAAVAQLVRLGREVGDVLDEVRSLATGVYPPLLADRGLGAALRSAAAHSSLPVRVETDGIGRYPRAVESAVYFCCLEAVQNAAKHAAATAVDVSLTGGDGLVFRVSDDGDGFAPGHRGSGAGLVNMRDRVEAVGGIFSVQSTPGRGTRIVGHVPCEALADAAPDLSRRRNGTPIGAS